MQLCTKQHTSQQWTAAVCAAYLALDYANKSGREFGQISEDECRQARLLEMSHMSDGVGQASWRHACSVVRKVANSLENVEQ